MCVRACRHIPCIVLRLCNHTDARLIIISWANGHCPRRSKAHHDLRSAHHTLKNLPTVVLYAHTRTPVKHGCTTTAMGRERLQAVECFHDAS